MKSEFLRGCLNKWKKTGNQIIPYAACEYCCQWVMWSSMHESCSLPNDVPKGHLVVYVGEKHTRFVIKIAVLNHPLFKALLDQAQEEYDFTAADSKLRIPCDEHLFLSVLRRATSAQNERVFLCH
ncbi:hypothetical protein TanjilG_09958 [Lupinus angustifolius]|uniref:Uncharacterized protein n=1 Tax=Lupinus angustifolius TaxID=3871 RepID=A0A1J7GQI9_LUPAN|nr:PREDICTED: indole-3-acetic acid-induced protein ARG7-like [Lupinus angustifolius]OIV92360.1 hypothetical protein TanjilG_09958 [Lupinus angustifolius]